MDFVTHLPRTPQGHDAVWVIVDQLMKSAHFLAVRMTFTLEIFCWLYIREIVRLHGVPLSIVSDRDSRFTGHFWKSFQKAMGTRLTISTVTPRFLVRPEWRIRTGSEARDYILGLFDCFFFKLNLYLLVYK